MRAHVRPIVSLVARGKSNRRRKVNTHRDANPELLKVILRPGALKNPEEPAYCTFTSFTVCLPLFHLFLNIFEVNGKSKAIKKAGGFRHSQIL